MIANRAAAFFEHAREQGFERRLVADSGLVRGCVWLLFALGAAARLSPLADWDQRLFWQYLSEDGYLMQTVARNMAIGLGMSVSEGTIPTNGVQPLATFVYAALHWLAGGSKQLAIAYVTVVSAAIAALTAWILYRLSARLLAGLPFAADAALLTAALWFASPLVIRHGMNGLETGFYYLAIAATLAHYFSAAAGSLRTAQRLTLGLLLGLAFLARNDAVFFIGALLAAHVLMGGAAGGGARTRIADALIAGLVSIAIASPWLAYNRLTFGSIVPISGSAQSLTATLGANLALIPANLLEASLLYVPIPGRIEAAWPTIVGSLTALLALGWAYWALLARTSLPRRRFALTALLFTAGIAGYYGLFFGAPHFVSRYLSSLTPLLWPICAAAAYASLAGSLRDAASFRAVGAAAAVLLLAEASVVTGVDISRGHTDGSSYMHKQVVDWVQRNVDAPQWVGAVQTGTLGYFHERTVNLDGKVNPEALRARRAKGHVLSYVLDETQIEYLVDWAGIAGWVELKADPRFGETFEVRVKDPSANLGVLGRKRAAR